MNEIKQMSELTNKLLRSIYHNQKLIEEHSKLIEKITNKEKISIKNVSCSNCPHVSRGKDCETGEPAGYWCSHHNMTTHDHMVLDDFFCSNHPFFK